MNLSRSWLYGVVCVSAALVIVNVATALDPNTRDPRAIMRAAANPEGLGPTLSRLRMIIKDGSGTRERLMTVRSKRYDGAIKSLVIIEQPAEVRNTGFLSTDYDARDRTDEQWLYLPKLRRVSRVPSSGKSDSFAGSDFTFADMGRQDPDDYELKMVEQSVKAGDEDCWLIEGVPRSEKIKTDIGYSKIQSWVSHAKGMPLQLKLWVNGSDKIKYFKVSDVRKVDGIWTPHRLQMRTVSGNTVLSETSLDVLSVSNASREVADADFTQQRLEGGS